MVTRILSNDSLKRMKACVVNGVLFCCVAGSAHGATQGDVGHISQGTVGISLTIPPAISLDGLRDVELSAEQGQSLAGTTPVCVSGTYQGAYSLAAQGSGSDNDFVLDSGSEAAAYTVSYSDAHGSGELRPSGGVDERFLASNTGCADGENAELTVSVDSADDPDRTSQVYTGTLTLLVIPL